MTAPVGSGAEPTDTAGLEILDRPECLRLLAKASLGRVVFTDRALPAVLPVGYTVHGTDIVIRTSPRSVLARATRDSVVAFEADDFDAAHGTGWSVAVLGTGRAVTDPAEEAELAALPLPDWAHGARPHFIRIEATMVSGRRLRPGPARGGPRT
ncbi:pyridoxamine 5'-phosphate oxidase family protein [Nocardiopsis mangrovi]|uniref:Pyridoxamine 5'-phosphate oxidase family protein n=1 Tax=Nocardiopsis mangrovi TaxID=1179818 RepID=A0ABV9DZ63_9ACTN